MPKRRVILVVGLCVCVCVCVRLGVKYKKNVFQLQIQILLNYPNAYTNFFLYLKYKYKIHQCNVFQIQTINTFLLALKVLSTLAGTSNCSKTT